MGAVDSHAVHALLQQLMDEEGIVRRFTRHGDHDADPAPRGRGTQEGVGMVHEQSPTGGKIEAALLRVRGRRTTSQTMHHVENSLDRRQHVRLAPAERRESEAG